MPKILTYGYIKEYIESYGYVLLSKKYVGALEKLKIRCSHGHEFYMGWTSFRERPRCAKCSGKKKKTITEIRELMSLEGYELSSKKYKNNKTKLKAICPHKHTYSTTWANFQQGYRCPSCFSSSRGEREVVRILDSYNVEYVPEARFDGCKRNLCLPFDFYVEKYNSCIEFNGQQHFEPVEFFGGEKRFKEQKKHDKIKRKFCKDNGIRLIEIPYWELNNIEEILIDALGLQ